MCNIACYFRYMLKRKNFFPIIGRSETKLKDNILPTRLDVLKRFTFLHLNNNKSLSVATTCVVNEVKQIWFKSGIEIQRSNEISRKVKKLYEDYQKVSKNIKRKTLNQKNKQQKFEESIENLFDISRNNAKIKRDEDAQFLIDQKTGRNMVMGVLDKFHAAAVERKVQRQNRLSLLKKRSEATENLTEFTPSDDSVSSNSTTSSENSMQINDVSSQDCRKDRENQNFISAKIPRDIMSNENVCSVADRLGLSNKQAFSMVEAILEASGADKSLLIFSESTVYRRRQECRKNRDEIILSNLNKQIPYVIHWDEKRIPNKQGVPENRLAVVLTGKGEEILLSVSKTKDGTGRVIADSVTKTVECSNLKRNVIGMSFDTTNANFGHKKGSAVIIEKELNEKLLYLPCRHHILDLVVKSSIQCLFGATVGPSTPFFEEFRRKWPQINLETAKKLKIENKWLLEVRTRAIDDLKKILTTSFYRADYKELTELSLFVLDQNYKTCFRPPGAHHHARWMAGMLYVLKMSIFGETIISDELLYKMRQLATFFSLFVASTWLNANKVADAAINDIKFMKEILQYQEINKIVGEKSFEVIARHSWYLTNELVVFFIIFQQNKSGGIRSM